MCPWGTYAKWYATSDALSKKNSKFYTTDRKEAKNITVRGLLQKTTILGLTKHNSACIKNDYLLSKPDVLFENKSFFPPSIIDHSFLVSQPFSFTDIFCLFTTFF